MQSFWRLAIWGTLAGVSLFFAVLSAYSSTGADRAAAAVAPSLPMLEKNKVMLDGVPTQPLWINPSWAE
jgi:hypothetical protein